MFFDAATGEPVARGGLSRKVFDGQPEVEVGWTVAPERWGEGLATELAAPRAVERGVRTNLGALPRTSSPTRSRTSGASRRVMEKLGFTY